MFLRTVELPECRVHLTKHYTYIYVYTYGDIVWDIFWETKLWVYHPHILVGYVQQKFSDLDQA